MSGHQQASIDENDLEDYYICLHLGLFSDRKFVTNDKGIRTAINRTITAFEQLAESDSQLFAKKVEILTTNDFISLFSSE